MELLKKNNGTLSLSKTMAAVAFVMAIVVVLVELLTSLQFEHFAEYLTFTTGIVAMATGRSVMDK